MFGEKDIKYFSGRCSMINLDLIKFGADGLIPAIVQDFNTKEVLTLAYMNRESLEITMRERRTCFFSRKRQALWRKGETSGNIQHVVSITADCDNDALLILAKVEGPACHTGENSCFYQELFEGDKSSDISIDSLFKLLQGRKLNPKEGSYTSYLFSKGQEKILKKVGEECTEVVIAALKNDKEETIFEISDLCYHVLVLMVENEISPKEILQELASRHIVDHKVKQESMK